MEMDRKSHLYDKTLLDPTGKQRMDRAKKEQNLRHGKEAQSRTSHWLLRRWSSDKSSTKEDQTKKERGKVRWNSLWPKPKPKPKPITITQMEKENVRGPIHSVVAQGKQKVEEKTVTRGEWLGGKQKVEERTVTRGEWSDEPGNLLANGLPQKQETDGRRGLRESTARITQENRHKLNIDIPGEAAVKPVISQRRIRAPVLVSQDSEIQESAAELIRANLSSRRESSLKLFKSEQDPQQLASVGKREDTQLNEKSRKQELFAAVKNGDLELVKSLYESGASLEWINDEGMTPLMTICADGGSLEMISTLLELGANLKACRSGVHGESVLHHAAKSDYQEAVGLLLSFGADPLALNNGGQTPLDIARISGHVSIVRLIEEWICLFSGVLREIVEADGDNAYGQPVTRKTWVVVLPASSDHWGHPRNELAVYHSQKVPLPRTVTLLGNITSEIEEPNMELADPVLIIKDKLTKEKLKFCSEHTGDNVQIKQLYNACKGIPQTGDSHSKALLDEQNGFIAAKNGMRPKHPSALEDAALAMAIDASITTARQERMRDVNSSSSSSGSKVEKHSFYPNSRAGTNRINRRARKQDTGNGVCVICSNAPAEAVCVPCGHLAACMECLALDKRCPVCRTSVTNVVRVFKV